MPSLFPSYALFSVLVTIHSLIHSLYLSVPSLTLSFTCLPNPFPAVKHYPLAGKGDKGLGQRDRRERIERWMCVNGNEIRTWKPFTSSHLFLSSVILPYHSPKDWPKGKGRWMGRIGTEKGNERRWGALPSRSFATFVSLGKTRRRTDPFLSIHP